MEVFASLIVFANIKWTEKVSIAFNLFDFDKNKTISTDELFIMSRCFIEAISLLTEGEPCSNFGIKELLNKINIENMTFEE